MEVCGAGALGGCKQACLARLGCKGGLHFGVRGGTRGRHSAGTRSLCACLIECVMRVSAGAQWQAGTRLRCSGMRGRWSGVRGWAAGWSADWQMGTLLTVKWGAHLHRGLAGSQPTTFVRRVTSLTHGTQPALWVDGPCAHILLILNAQRRCARFIPASVRYIVRYSTALYCSVLFKVFA